MNHRKIQLVWLVLAVAAVPAKWVSGAGNVYLVLGSDTALWNYPVNAPTTVDAYHFNSYYKPDLLTSTNNAGFKVMDPAFRNRFLDSYGQPLKLTWWMMGGNVFRYATNLNIPIPNLMTSYLMLKYHGDAIRQFGDEVSLHYHTYVWNDPNGDGTNHWNQSRTFLESREDFDYTLAQLLVEEGIFPVSFRSGWHFMDNDWQQYLDTLLPYCLHDDYGVRRDWNANLEPIGGVENWSVAPAVFVPFHPSPTNYQVAGEGKGWNLRSVKMQNATSNHLNEIFAAAAGGTDQVACFWSHLPEDFLNQVVKVDALVHGAVSNYPNVTFRYCAAVEAMQRWLGHVDDTAPQLLVHQEIVGQTVTLTIQTSQPIWQPQPFIVLKDIWQGYAIVACTNTGLNTWATCLPKPRNCVAKVGIAVTGLTGNLTTQIIRYQPDDIFVDNLDSEYAELGGIWGSSTNAAWGIDSRFSRLASNDVARAQWLLPVTRSGKYQLSIQVPAWGGGASNLAFDVISGGTNLLGTLVNGPLPGNQWVTIGMPYLDHTLSNVLQMVVNGSTQPGAIASADVLRISPVPDTNAPLITCSSNLVVACDGTNGTSVAFQVNATDGDDPHPTLASDPGSGSVFPVGTTVVHCTAGDASGNTSDCSFTVTVVNTNHPPVAFAHAAATGENEPLIIAFPQLLSGDYDPDNDLLTVSAQSISIEGATISLTSSNLTYQPPLNFVGVDSFDYQLTDGKGGTASAAVQILVLSGPVPRPGHLAIIPSRGTWTIRFAGPTGAQCWVQRSQDLSTWETLESVQIPIYGILDYQDTNPLPERAFYRIAIP